MPCFFRQASVLSFCWRASWSLSTFSGFSLRLRYRSTMFFYWVSFWQASSAALVAAISSSLKLRLSSASSP